MAQTTGWEQCLHSLQHWRRELSARLEAVDEAYGEMAAAIDAVPNCVWADAPAKHASGKTVNGQQEEKFELTHDCVPQLVTATPKSRQTEYSLSRVNTGGQTAGGFRILEDWREGFVVNEAEATMMYNYLYSQRKKRVAVYHGRPQEARRCADSSLWVSWADFTWGIMTLVLVAVDAVFLPLSLSWPSLIQSGTTLDLYYQVTPGLWISDIVVAFLIALHPTAQTVRWQRLRSYLCRRFPFDVTLVLVDLTLLAQLIPEDFKVLTLLRLLRAAKFKAVMGAFENRLAKRGNITFVYWSTIIQSIASVLVVNHTLACAIFYIGRLGQQSEMPNWLDTYGILDYSDPFQYMMSFNWVIAQYTPAPFPYRAQTEIEEVLILGMILICLPLLGAQIGKITGTLNLMNEKAKERDHVKRDLQRWLHKTKVPEELKERMSSSLDDVLNSAQSPLEVKDPMALKFLPSTLLEELRVVKTGETLSLHPLFQMIMDDRLQLAGSLVSAFRVLATVAGERVFTVGSRAEGLHVTISGRFSVLCQEEACIVEAERGVPSKSLSPESHSLDLAPDTWVGELCLYTEINHSATLTSLAYAKCLRVSPMDFLKAVRESPAAIVAIHEYAVELLKLAGKPWELLPHSQVDDCVSHTQLGELLNPGTGRIHNLKNSEAVDLTDLASRLLSRPWAPEDLCEEIKDKVVELRDNGLYAHLHHHDEAKRAVLSVLSMLWLLKGDYEQMVSCQKLPTRLSKSTWTAIQELLCWEMTPAQLTALLVLLAIRGLSKSADFTKLCPPSERRSPESVLDYAVSNLKSYIPSLAGLPAESADYVVSTVRMLGQFSFPQFLQGENNPHSVWMLQSCLKQEEEVVFKMFLLAQVCVLCGVTGAKSIQGSHFLNELNGRSVLKALSCLQNIADARPQAVYWRYIAARAWSLQLEVQQAGDLVLARLACLTRTVDPQRLRELKEEGAQLTDSEQDALHEIFLLDGHLQKAFIFQYLPLFLTNAMENTDLGLRCGLQFLVELYGKLLDHRCLSHAGPTVRVDIYSLASIVAEVDSLRTLRRCLEFVRIVKHGSGVTALLTKQSYQVLSGQLVTYDRNADLLEVLAAQQLRLEKAISWPGGAGVGGKNTVEASGLEPVEACSF